MARRKMFDNLESVLMLRVSPDWKKRLEQLAATYHLSASDYMRRIVAWSLEIPKGLRNLAILPSEIYSEHAKDADCLGACVYFASIAAPEGRKAIVSALQRIP